MANGFSASLDDSFVQLDDVFSGDDDFAEYGVVGSPAQSAQGNGVLLAEGSGLHFGDKLLIDPCYVHEVGFCISLDDTVNGDGGVQDGNALWVGIQNGVYNTDPTTSTKSIFFRIAPTGADSSVISVYAKDGTTTYSFSTGKSLKALPSRLVINFSRGWKEVQLLIDGHPVHYLGRLLDLSGVLETDWMQALVYMKAKASSPESNDLRLHQWRVKSRTQRGLVRPPSAAIPPTL